MNTSLSDGVMRLRSDLGIARIRLADVALIHQPALHLADRIGGKPVCTNCRDQAYPCSTAAALGVEV